MMLVVFGALLLVSVPFPAQATDSNQVDFWCETGVKIEPTDTPFIVPAPPANSAWTLLVLKAATDNHTVANPVVGQAYVHPNGHDISHVILCYEEEVPPSTTTTSTSIPTTTTTELPSTTTTTEPNPTTTTTEPPTTTTTEPPTSTTTTTDPGSSTTTTEPTTTTTEVPPPTYIESGSGGYVEEDHGHETINWIVLILVLVIGMCIGGIAVATANIYWMRDRD